MNLGNIWSKRSTEKWWETDRWVVWNKREKAMYIGILNSLGRNHLGRILQWILSQDPYKIQLHTILKLSLMQSDYISFMSWGNKHVGITRLQEQFSERISHLFHSNQQKLTHIINPKINMTFWVRGNTTIQVFSNLDNGSVANILFTFKSCALIIYIYLLNNIGRQNIQLIKKLFAIL